MTVVIMKMQKNKIPSSNITCISIISENKRLITSHYITTGISVLVSIDK